MTVKSASNARLVEIYTESEDRDAVIAAGEELARRGITSF